MCEQSSSCSHPCSHPWDIRWRWTSVGTRPRIKATEFPRTSEARDAPFFSLAAGGFNIFQHQAHYACELDCSFSYHVVSDIFWFFVMWRFFLLKPTRTCHENSLLHFDQRQVFEDGGTLDTSVVWLCTFGRPVLGIMTWVSTNDLQSHFVLTHI